MPNFTRLDSNRPDVAMMIEAIATSMDVIWSVVLPWSFNLAFREFRAKKLFDHTSPRAAGVFGREDQLKRQPTNVRS
jgi:hypothetical protein